VSQEIRFTRLINQWLHFPGRVRGASCLSPFFVPFVFPVPFVFLVSFVLHLLFTATHAADPTLARLSFWVPTERLAEFSIAYRERVVPKLSKHGLIGSDQKIPTIADGVFSKLFELSSVKAVLDKQAALEQDASWKGLLLDLGRSFGSTLADSTIQHRFGLYAAPASEGKRVVAGEGSGFWRTYQDADAFPLSSIAGIVQDREGYMWFGGTGGVSRFDGISHKLFTTEDGLARNWVWPMAIDRQGNIWCGTGDLHDVGAGVSRYDGTAWQTFTTADGLVDNGVMSMLEDREGNLWFGTGKGVSRYDPSVESIPSTSTS